MSSTTHTASTIDASGNLDMVFDLNDRAWAPRTDVYVQALDFARNYGHVLPSPQAVYAALRKRGFTETKIDGVYGFRGIAPAYSPTVLQRHHHNPNSLVHLSPWAQDATE